MPKSTDYIEAKKEYGTVKYFPFSSLPADPFILTADPWNYLIAWLETEIKLYNGKKGGKPVQQKLQKAIYFTKLAQNFEISAFQLSLPIKALPQYYSALNLVKAFLLVRGIVLESKMESHGVILRTNEKEKLHVGKQSNNESINIFLEFAKQLKVNCHPGQEINLKEVISELPEIHEIAYNLKKFDGKRKFLPINLNIKTNTKRTHLIYEIEIDKKHSQRYDLTKLRKEHWAEKLDDVSETNAQNLIVYRSKSKFNYTADSDLSWKKNYSKLCTEINSLNVATMLSRSGHRYYLNLRTNSMGQMVNYFLILFYLGSVARYRPTLVEEYLKGDFQAVFNEVLSTSPKQFLYNMVSHITGKVCAVPMAKLD